MTTQHFHATVSEQAKTKLLELAELVQSEVISNFTSDACGCTNLTTIHGCDESGYIALQHGGYSVIEWYSNNQDRSQQLTRKQSEWIDKTVHDAWVEFCSENNLNSSNDLPEHFEDDYYEYEREYLGDCLAMFRCWVTDDNQSVNIDFGANYKDAPNYRDNCAETILEFTLPVERFNNIDINTLIRFIKLKLNKSDKLLHYLN